MNSAKPRLLIFIVAYHAETTIERVVRRVPAELLIVYDVEILIIDDSSSDQTFNNGMKVIGDISIPYKVTVLYNPVNHGYGSNQKIGYHYAMNSDSTTSRYFMVTASMLPKYSRIWCVHLVTERSMRYSALGC